MFDPQPGLIGAGLQVMSFGLLGVFTVLILFYFCTKGILAAALKLTKKSDE